MKRQITLFFIVVLNISVSAQSSRNYATIPPDFVKLSYEDANRAIEREDTLINAERIEQIGPEYIANLVSQLRHGHLNNDNKTLAIYFLGLLHPSETNSIDYLIQNIDFKASRHDSIDKSHTDVQRWGDYPAVDALIRIGRPAVSPILNDLPSENGELRRSLLCNVLREVLRSYLNSPN